MKLFLVRHGEAVSAMDHSERPLSPAGEHDLRRVAMRLKDEGHLIDRIYHSTKLRAKQTAEIIQQTVNPSIPLNQKNGLCPNDPVGPMADEISRFTSSVMLVGHLPYMGMLLADLVGEDHPDASVRFIPGTIVILESGTERPWRLVSELNPCQ